MDGTLAEIRGFAGNFAPRNWAYCNGQLLSISSNQALFSLLGTTYGGDGRTTFALPDLRGRTMIGPGHGPGLSQRNLGSRSGTERNTLTINQMPAHNHVAQLNAAGAQGNTANPTNASLAAGQGVYNNTTDPTVGMNSGSITLSMAGGSQSVNNMQPFLATHYIICIQGLFPTRS